MMARCIVQTPLRAVEPVLSAMDCPGQDILWWGHSTAVECPILVVSFFDGIGGAFRLYDVLGVAPSGRI
jgi:hypothetical protein